jgi:hypothetical protein
MTHIAGDHIFLFSCDSDKVRGAVFVFLALHSSPSDIFNTKAVFNVLISL